MSNVVKIAEEALSRNGYRIKVSIKTDQKAVYVTERKVSPCLARRSPAHGINTCCPFMRSLRTSPRLSVKADFEKLAQGGRILSVSAEEVAEIERSLIREINKALASPIKPDALPGFWLCAPLSHGDHAISPRTVREAN